VIKLLTLWAAWRLLRALVPILVAATVALLLLGAATRSADHRENAVGRSQHTTQPLEQQLQHTLQRALAP
jgi:outer membrane biogenesis lipoprotein LolB